MSRSLIVLSLVPALWLAGCGLGPDRVDEIYGTNVYKDLGGTRPPEAAQNLAQEMRASVDDIADLEVLTLADAFRAALVRTEGLYIASEQILQDFAARREAIARLLPSVSASGVWQRDQLTAGQEIDTTAYTLRAEQTLFDLSIPAGIRVADQAAVIDRLGLEDARDQLLFGVAAAFYRVLTLEADAEALAASRARLVEQVRVLRARQEVGEAHEQDVLLVEARLRAIEANLVQARHAIRSARVTLATLLGVPDVKQPLADTFEVRDLPEQEAPVLVDLALARRPDVEAARQEIERAKGLKALQRSAYFPFIGARYDHYLDTDVDPPSPAVPELDWTVSIVANWSLFDGGAREARVAQAASLVRIRRLQVSALEKTVRRDVTDAVLGFRSLTQALEAFRRGAEAAAGAERRVRQRLEQGLVSTLDVLAAQEARQDAERNLARTLLARKLAALRIRLVIGDMNVVAPVRQAVEAVMPSAAPAAPTSPRVQPQP